MAEIMEAVPQTIAIPKIKKPSQWQVMLHNDDITPMEVVVYILNRVFHKDIQDSTSIMLEAHERGRALIGIYSYDTAHTYKIQADGIIKEVGVPLKITAEKIEE